MRTIETVDIITLPHEVALWEVLAYAAGALPYERAAHISTHLEGCALCRTRLKDIPEIDHMFALEDDPEVPTPGQVTLTAKVYRHARQQLRADRLWVLGAAAPFKLALLRTALRTRETRGRRLMAGVSALALTGAVLHYALRRR